MKRFNCRLKSFRPKWFTVRRLILPLLINMTSLATRQSGRVNLVSLIRLILIVLVKEKFWFVVVWCWF